MAKRTETTTGVEAPTRMELVGIALASVPVSLTDPVRVRPPTSDQWSAQTLALGPRPTEVVGRRVRRARAVLRNLDAENDIVVSRTREPHRPSGFVLPPGAEVELRHVEEVYAWAPEGSPEVTVLVEHDR